MFYQIVSLPYIALFYGAWVVASLAQPIAFVSLLCLLAQPQSTIRKAKLLFNTLVYLLLCNDKSWTAPKEDPESFFLSDDVRKSEPTKIDKRTIIFVRHGESTWNDTFNRGDRSKVSFVLNFIPNLIFAALMEFFLFVSGRDTESWFYDSPLSYKGVNQAIGLRRFLQSTPATEKEADFIKLMLADDHTASSLGHNKQNGNKTAGRGENALVSPSSQLVSSNLRRAISTMALGFQDRLDKQLPDDSILIVPELQEISRNPDALSITPAGGELLPSWSDRDVPHCDFDRVFSKQVDLSLNKGNKPVNTNGLKRLRAFCNLAFTNIERDIIIVGGHSLWFRSFFRTYLPRTFEHVSKKKKLVNGGCVSFTLKRVSMQGDFEYMIDPRSITVLYGGF